MPIPSNQRPQGVSDDHDENAHMLPFEITSDDLSEQAFSEVIQNFICPEGSEFGLTEAALQSKERLALKQVASGSLKIITDPGSETTVLMSSQDWRNLQSRMKN